MPRRRLWRNSRREWPQTLFHSGGGSNEIGALGYVSCAYEMLQQFDEQELDVGWIVLASGSAGTHAGLLAGYTPPGGYPGRGISVRQPVTSKLRQCINWPPPPRHN